jgi:hypothetical protein
MYSHFGDLVYPRLHSKAILRYQYAARPTNQPTMSARDQAASASALHSFQPSCQPRSGTVVALEAEFTGLY